MDRLFEKVWNYVAHDRPASMQSRLYRLICLIAGILCIVVIIPLNLVQGLSPTINVTVFLFGLFSLFCYWASTRGKDHVLGYFAVLVLVLNLIWFPNGGSEGSIIYYFAACVIYPMVLLKGKVRWTVFGLLLLDACGLLVLEYFFPDLAEPFHSSSDRLIDLITGIFCSSLAGALSLWVVITNYDKEHALITDFSHRLEESEKRYREVVENTNTVILRLDRTGTITFFNTFAERLFGYPRNEVIGKKIMDTIAPAPVRTEVDLVSMVREIAGDPGKYAHVETENICRDGKRVWISWTNQPITGPANELVEILCVGSDLSERKRMVSVVQHSEQQLQTILDNTPAVVYVKDKEYRYKLINRRYEELFHVSGDVIQGKTDYDLFPKETADVFRTNDRLVLEKGQSIQFDELVPQNNGMRNYLSVKFPLYNLSGVVQGICGIAMDVTERKEAEEKLRRSLQNLDLHLRQTPLGAITWNLAFQVMEWNPAAETIFGYTRDEALSRHAVELIVPDHVKENVKQVWRELISNKGGTRSTNENITKNGTIIHCEWFNTPLVNEKGQVIGVASLVQNITEQKRANEALLRSEKRFRDLLERINLVAVMLDRNGTIAYCNDYLLKISGWLREDLLQKNWFDLFIPADARDAVRSVHKANLGSGMILHHEHPILTRAGHRRQLVWDNVIMHDLEGAVTGVASIGMDITEHTKLEEQLRQAQKMEAIGHLAGGVAHDFNNILTAIIGYGNLVKMNIRPSDPAYSYAEQILASSERAANLTHSLLAYSRKQVIEPRPVDINMIVAGLKKILDRIIGEDIEIRVEPSPRPLIIRGDKNQLEQVVMNLVTNARDAMTMGGLLTISTEEFSLDAQFIQANQFGTPGRYALLSVSDTGMGMDERTRERIFDPFFTTKEVGKGTGLGLAMAYGTIKQHGGFIDVSSVPDKGTTFRIYLPVAEQMAVSPAEKTSPSLPSGNELLLLVEDDHSVRKVTRIMLEGLGYTVLDASDGAEALQVFAENKDAIQLVITDIIMPKQSGKEVYYELQKIKPGVKVLFISGYTADMLAQKGINEEGLNFIPKPLRPETLSIKIREILNT